MLSKGPDDWRALLLTAKAAAARQSQPEKESTCEVDHCEQEEGIAPGCILRHYSNHHPTEKIAAHISGHIRRHHDWCGATRSPFFGHVCNSNCEGGAHQQALYDAQRCEN